MIVGFKTGTKNWEVGKKIVLEDGGRMCEIWFNVGKPEQYEDMFAWLKEHEVMVGLHHWGVVDGKFKTNLATQDEHIRSESLVQMKRTIDIGKQIGAVYVNVHPGARWLETMDFEKQMQSLVPDSETPVEISARLLLEGAQQLYTYGVSQNVLVIVETLPGKESVYFIPRQGIYDPGNPPLSLMEQIGGQGGFIANDFTHSATMAALADSSRERMWQALRDFTQRTASFTRLLHLNTTREPFDGTESHDGLTSEDFAQGFFPSREQILELLQFFSQRDDMYVVPEPQIEATRANFLALKKIAEEAKLA